MIKVNVFADIAFLDFLVGGHLQCLPFLQIDNVPLGSRLEVFFFRVAENKTPFLLGIYARCRLPGYYEQPPTKQHHLNTTGGDHDVASGCEAAVG